MVLEIDLLLSHKVLSELKMRRPGFLLVSFTIDFRHITRTPGLQVFYLQNQLKFFIEKTVR